MFALFFFIAVIQTWYVAVFGFKMGAGSQSCKRSHLENICSFRQERVPELDVLLAYTKIKGISCRQSARQDFFFTL